MAMHLTRSGCEGIKNVVCPLQRADECEADKYVKMDALKTKKVDTDTDL
jgi:hypothetical protein